MLQRLKWAFPILIGVLLTYSLFIVALQTKLGIAKWAPVCVAVWFLHASLTGWSRLSTWDYIGIYWGTISSYNFLCYLLYDTDFQGWGDVYFFCGANHQYCTCHFHWNILGWWKAFALWNFSIAFAFGLQKLALLMGLGGLLPGEEVVTKDSFISVCWRLVPYWLNNWEQNWGTECSSMLFEVPRFAMELLVILPCVQIVASRLKILVAAQIRVVMPEEDANDLRRDDIAVNIVKGHWELDPSQKSLMQRLKANARVMLFLVLLLGFAAFNSLWVPLKLEQESLTHPRANLAIEAGEFLEKESSFEKDMCSLCDVWTEILSPAPPVDICPASVDTYISLYSHNYESRRGCCQKAQLFEWAIRKHSKELGRMKDFDHRRMIPLIEVTLAMMRFSCEKFFVLLTVYVNYLIFRKPPRAARMLVRVNSNLSSIFQHVVLYTFPAICWIYGAGIIFSSFVSLIFWGAPLTSMYRKFIQSISGTVLKGLSPMTAEHIDRMGGNCAICWGPLKLPSSTEPESSETKAGSALQCGHAYHSACLVQWLEQCVGLQRVPKCPMCQAPIEYHVDWRWPWSRAPSREEIIWEVDAPDAANPEDEDDDFLFGDPYLQNILEEMPDIPAEVVEDAGHIQRIIGRQELQNHPHQN